MHIITVKTNQYSSIKKQIILTTDVMYATVHHKLWKQKRCSTTISTNTVNIGIKLYKKYGIIWKGAVGKYA